MKNVFLIAVVVLLSTQCTLNAQNKIDWETDFDRAQNRASAEKKLILLHFAADWCRPCRNLETYVFTNPIAVEAIREQVIPVKVDVDLHPDKVQEYGVTAVPYDVLLTPNGRIISQRKSPGDASAYVRMVKGNESASNNIAKNKQPLADELDQLRSQLIAKRPLTENNDFQPKGDFAPAAPSHQQPMVNDSGLQLARKAGKVVNPFAPGASTDANSMRAVTAKSEPPVTLSAVHGQVVKNATNEDSNGIKITNQFVPRDNSSLKTPVADQQVAQSPTGMHQKITNPMFAGAAKQQVVDNQFTRPENPGSFAVNQVPAANKDVNEFQPPIPANPVRGSNEMETKGNPIATAAPSRDAQVAPTNANQWNESAAEVAAIDAGPAAPRPPKTAEPILFALKGKCPVTLIKEGKWIDGDKKIGCTHRGRTYLFTSQENLAVFQADPDRYSPIMAGYDPVAYHDSGELVDGNEEFGVFMGKLPNQRVVLFASQDARSKFQQNPKLYIEAVRQARTNSDQGRKFR